MRVKTMKNSLKLKYKSKEEKVKEDVSKKAKKELLETVEKSLILSMQKARNGKQKATGTFFLLF
jgi:hypothetical protein